MKHLLYLLLLLTPIFLFSSNTLGQVTDHTPWFTGGGSQTLTICENTAAISINTLLAVIDSDAGDTETWSAVALPSQGTLVASYTAISTGDTIIPTGLTYTPGSGYSGLDSFVVSISDGIESDTTTIYVTINPLPSAGAITGTPGVCISDTTTLYDTVSGGIWGSSSTSVATINGTSGTITGLSGGTCSIIYTVTNTCGTAVASLPFTVNTTVPPVPAGIGGLHAVCINSAITLRDATPGGKWISSDLSIASIDSNLGIVTGISAGLAAITYAEANFCASYYSVITLAVDALPSVIIGTSQFCMSVTTVLSDSLTGGTWSSSNTGITAISPYTGMATGISLGTASITYITGVAGCKVTEMVTVNATPATFTLVGGGPYCAGGMGASIGLSGSTTGIGYQLYRGSLSVGTPVAGTGAVLDFGLQTIAGTYTVVATDTLTGCDKNMPGSVTISINPLPSSYAVTGGGSYCPGGTGYHIYLVASQGGVSYQLYNGAAATGVSISGTGGALDFGIHSASGTYTVIATNLTTGCTRTMTGTATITVNTSPTIFALLGGGSYCAGGTGAHVGLDSSTTGIDYQLYNSGTAYGSPISGTGIPLDFGLISAAGLYTIIATNPATACTSDMSGSATVVINPPPTLYSVTGGGHYCLGGTGTNISLSNSTAGIVYQLYNGTSTTGIALLGTDSVLNFGLHTAPGIYTMVATNTTTTCTANMSGSATIIVDSLPTLYEVTGGGSYCAGDYGVYIGTSGSDIGTEYQLYDGTATSGIPERGSGGGLDLGLETIAGLYTIVATDMSTGCTDTMPGNATVVVNPVPAAITGIDSIYTGATTTLSDATPGGTWSSENTSIATAGPTGIIYADSIGYDTIAYTLPTGCVAKVEVTVNYPPIDTSTSAVGQGLNRSEGIDVFPNPASNTLHIDWENQLTGKAAILITDVAGREVYKSSMNFNMSSGRMLLQLDLENGLYLLSIKSEGIHYTIKLLVQQ